MLRSGGWEKKDQELGWGPVKLEMLIQFLSGVEGDTG